MRSGPFGADAPPGAKARGSRAGCHLIRDIPPLLAAGGFRVREMEADHLPVLIVMAASGEMRDACRSRAKLHKLRA